jgi:hypothetical protein
VVPRAFGVGDRETYPDYRGGRGRAITKNARGGPLVYATPGERLGRGWGNGELASSLTATRVDR